MQDIPTWMAGHAKFAAVYAAPFWRDAGLSGDAISARGPLAEIHDASGMGGTPAALFGFAGVPAEHRRGRAKDIETAALEQLARLFGDAALSPTATALIDWAYEPETATRADHTPLTAHPAYGLPAALSGLWDGRLHFASSEVAHEAGGFMEGALAAAERAARQVTRA
jgi:monoamine oxidase